MWTEAQYRDFVARSYAYLNTVQNGLKSDYSLGSYERFDWDQLTGVMTFSHEGVVRLNAHVQFVGSISSETKTWLWSWANDSILDTCKERITDVKQFGELHGLDELTVSKWKATEEDGWAMTAISANILQAKGAYRAPAANGLTYFVFTSMHWHNDTT
jgi:hypothetical protein